jgi:hypothetical protein
MKIGYWYTEQIFYIPINSIGYISGLATLKFAYNEKISCLSQITLKLNVTVLYSVLLVEVTTYHKSLTNFIILYQLYLTINANKKI